MDESFFQTLRQIQKKERTNASLARVGPDFYKQVHSYINKLKRSVGNDPFSNEHYLLKDSQRIATEICERREHKITDAAVMNIHRSYHLFSKDNPEFDLLDTTPLNLTKEEETLYFSLIDTLKDHRSKISLDKFANKEDNELPSNRQPITNPFDDESANVEESQSYTEDSNINNLDTVGNDTGSNANSEDLSLNEPKVKPSAHSAISDRLNQIKNAKIIKDEKYQSIDKQIANQKYPSGNDLASNSDNTKEFDNSNNLNQSNDDGSFSNDYDDSNVGNTNVQSQDTNSNGENTASKSFNSSNNEVKVSSKSFNPTNNNVNVGSKSFNSGVNNGNKSNSDAPNVNSLYGGSEEFINVDDLEKNYEDDYYNQISKEPNPFDVDQFINNSPNPNKSSSNHSNESALPKKDTDKCTIVICESVEEAIVGIDEKVYGPFSPQDIVVLPKINAEIFINANKAKLMDI